MTQEEKIESAFIVLIDSRVPVQTLPAQVTAVNSEKGTCDVEFLDKDLAPHKGVHLNSGLSTSNGFMQIPKINSFVYVSIVNNDEQWAFVSLFTELDEIRLRGNDFGGLAIVGSVTDRFNAIEKDLNKLKTVFKNWITAGGDGGAALKALASEWYASQLTETKRSDIENDKVNHG